MVSHACAACGKSITEAALAQGTAVEHSGRIYCATCASLIVTPGSLPVVGQDVQDSLPPKGHVLQISQEYKVSYNAPDIPSPFAVVDPPADVNSIDGVASDMAQNDDDEWFKPRNSGSVGTADAGSAPRISVKPAAARVPVAPRPAAKSSGVSSRVGMKPAAPAPTAPSTSGRVAAPSARMNAVPPPAAASPKTSGILEPKKSGRISSVKPATPLSKSSSRRGPAIRPSAVVQAAAPAPEVAEVVDEPEQDVVAAPTSKGKSSRRMPAAKSSASARATSSSRSSKRDEREEKDGKKDKKKGAKGGDMTMIYGGVAAVVVLILLAVFATSGGKEDETGAKAVNKEEIDKTPSGQYASRAEKELASGSRKEAVRLYTKASEQAEREGNSSKALNYNMKAVTLMKSSKIQDH